MFYIKTQPETSLAVIGNTMAAYDECQYCYMCTCREKFRDSELSATAYPTGGWARSTHRIGDIHVWRDGRHCVCQHCSKKSSVDSQTGLPSLLDRPKRHMCAVIRQHGQ